MKHTPGPWTATKVPTSIGHAWKFDPCGGCIYVDDRGGVEFRPADEAAANARLIAAAPDMLAALQEIADADNLHHARGVAMDAMANLEVDV